jgi:hypothetical protein
MTLIRLIQAASILAGVTVAGLSFHNNPVHADTPTPQFCVIASNGKTACGTLKEVERACVTTDDNKTVCGKYKSVRGEQAQGQTEARNPVQSSGFRKEVDNIVFTLDSCKQVGTEVSCQVSAKNKGKDRTLSTTPSSCSLVDSSGKSHSGSSIDIGRGLNQSSTTANIAPDSEFYTTIVFSGISQQITKVQLLSISFYSGLSGKPVQFKNIPISN